jgi:hypothetical protein
MQNLWFLVKKKMVPERTTESVRGVGVIMPYGLDSGFRGCVVIPYRILSFRPKGELLKSGLM